MFSKKTIFNQDKLAHIKCIIKNWLKIKEILFTPDTIGTIHTKGKSLLSETSITFREGHLSVLMFSVTVLELFLAAVMSDCCVLL